MSRRLVVATSNPGKRAELLRLLRAALGPAAQRLTLLGLEGLPGPVLPDEDAPSYEGNALQKARAVAALDPAAAVLADDSGLEVEALGGEPGLRSARWATAPDGSPLDGPGLNAALLCRLGCLPWARRRARMVCAVAVVLPGRPPVTGRGAVDGLVAAGARPGAGFGYDAVFALPDGRRFSGMPPEEKDAVSHRGHAVRAVAPAVASWISETSR
jgi:XTP/dITP diphosphohydrolase